MKARPVSRVDWYTQLRGRLRAVRYFSEDEIDALVAEVEEHCAESGERPEEAFGTAEEYAEGLLRERVPEAERARWGVDGITGRDVLVVVGLMACFHLVVSAIVLMTSGTWVVEVTLAGLAGYAALGLVAGMWTMGAIARKSGRPRWGRLYWIGSAPLVVLAAVLFTQLPKTVLGQVWSVLLALVGVAGMAVLLPRLRWTRRQRVPAEPREAEQWFRRLRGLLVGRHEIAPGAARRIVAESRAHLRGSAATPEEEFGPIEQYALRVAEQAEHQPPWWRRQEIFAPVMSVLSLSVFVFAVLRGEAVVAWGYLLAGLLFAVTTVRARRRDPARSRQRQ